MVTPYLDNRRAHDAQDRHGVVQRSKKLFWNFLKNLKFRKNQNKRLRRTSMRPQSYRRSGPRPSEWRAESRNAGFPLNRHTGTQQYRYCGINWTVYYYTINTPRPNRLFSEYIREVHNSARRADPRTLIPPRLAPIPKKVRLSAVWRPVVLEHLHLGDFAADLTPWCPSTKALQQGGFEVGVTELGQVRCPVELQTYIIVGSNVPAKIGI